jgi:hypothetical protein
MGKLIPRWIEFWLITSTIICALDMSYTMLRPHSLKDGAIGKFFYFWHIYASVDLRYANWNDLTSMSTGRLMTVELVMNILAIYMDRKESRHTLLTVFTSSVFVLWKTSIYLCMLKTISKLLPDLGLYISPAAGNIDYIAEGTTLWQLIFVFWAPNLVWVVVPFCVIVALWNRSV